MVSGWLKCHPEQCVTLQRSKVIISIPTSHSNVNPVRMELKTNLRKYGFFQTGEWIWKATSNTHFLKRILKLVVSFQAPVNYLIYYSLTCAEPTVHALPASVRELPAKSVTLRRLQGPRLPGEWWMSEGNNTQQKKKIWMDGWEDGREHDGGYII